MNFSKQTLVYRRWTAAFALLLALFLPIFAPNPTFAVTDSGGSGGGNQGGNNNTSKAPPIGGDCSAGVAHCDLVTKYLNPLIKFMAALVGIAVAASVVVGGIQYASSEGDPQKASAAKNRIRNAILALVTFVFLYALLNFLVPGGLL